MGFMSNLVGVVLWMLVVVGIATVLTFVGINRTVAVLIGMGCWWLLQQLLKGRAGERADTSASQQPEDSGKGAIYTESEIEELKKKGLK
jgi:hypothetical protein